MSPVGAQWNVMEGTEGEDFDAKEVLVGINALVFGEFHEPAGIINLWHLASVYN